ncbi:MAG: dihydrodipicolinate synthase family protein [Pirellulaceae bacterium]|nr:dihydrodipicolinate synthase family protein [Planctomycetales bacterium]
MSRVTELCGIVPPLVTPLSGPDRLDHAALERILEHVMGAGVHGLFLLGTTGEAAALSYRVRREYVKRIVDYVDGRIPLLVNVTHTSLVETQSLADQAGEDGADAIVVTTPYYLTLEPGELLRYVTYVSQCAALPVFIYNMPGLTKTAFALETVREIMEQLPNVVGMKDSSGDFDYLRQVLELKDRCRPQWRVFVGPERYLVDTVMHGGSGCVGGGANIWPSLFVELYQAAISNDTVTLASLREKLAELGAIYQYGAFGVGVIRGIKCAMELLGLCENHLAFPFQPVNELQRSSIRDVLARLELLPSRSRAE